MFNAQFSTGVLNSRTLPWGTRQVFQMFRRTPRVPAEHFMGRERMYLVFTFRRNVLCRVKNREIILLVSKPKDLQRNPCGHSSCLLARNSKLDIILFNSCFYQWPDSSSVRLFSETRFIFFYFFKQIDSIWI